MARHLEKQAMASKLAGDCEEETLVVYSLEPANSGSYSAMVKNNLRLAAMTFAMAAGLGLAGLGVAADAQAQPGPFPQWCPGDFWDPGWGDNWDGGQCHDNSRGYGDRGWPGDHGGYGDHGGPGNHR